MNNNWTADQVGKRLIDAFRTLDRMPRVAGPRAAGNHWPRHAIEWADNISQAELPEDERRARAAERTALSLRPSGADIDRMEATLDWLRWLRDDDAGLAHLLTLWALRMARHRSVAGLCRDQGWQKAIFYYRRNQALARLAATLNRRAVAGF